MKNETKEGQKRTIKAEKKDRAPSLAPEGDALKNTAGIKFESRTFVRLSVVTMIKRLHQGAQKGDATNLGVPSEPRRKQIIYANPKRTANHFRHLYDVRTGLLVQTKNNFEPILNLPKLLCQITVYYSELNLFCASTVTNIASCIFLSSKIYKK